MTPLRLHHVGLAVASLEAAVPVYQQLFGYALLNGPVQDPRQKCAVCFLGAGLPGEVLTELVAPLGEDSPVSKLLARGISLYHVCYEVDDLEQALAEARGNGCLIVGRPVPAVAFQGRHIAWFYTPTRQLVEFVEH